MELSPWFLALYTLKIAVDFLLLSTLLKARLWRVFPAFAAYLLFSGVRSIVLACVLLSEHDNAYTLLFVFTQPAEIALLAWVIADVLRRLPNLLVELIDHPAAFWVVMQVSQKGRIVTLALGGSCAAVMFGDLIWGRLLKWSGEIGPAMAVSAHYQEWNRISLWTLVCAAAFFIPIYAEARQLLSGIVVASLFPALIMYAHAMQQRTAIHAAPLVSYLVAQFLWIGWMRSLAKYRRLERRGDFGREYADGHDATQLVHPRFRRELVKCGVGDPL